jgi:diguanylate cyclase (GGDEF)-like protein/PAS domain S-box-containing protein
VAWSPLERGDESTLTDAELRLVLESVSDVVVWTTSDGVVAFVSPSVTSVLGWTPAQMVGRPVVELWHPDDVPASRLARAEALGTGAARLRGRILTSGGDYRWFDVSGHPARTPSGEPAGVVAVLRDVDAEVSAQAEATVWNLTLSSLLEAMTDPSVLLEPVRDVAGDVIDFRFAMANRALSEFLGVGEASPVGRLLGEVQAEARTAYLFDRYVEVLETGTPLSLDAVRRFVPAIDDWRFYDLRANRCGDLLGVTFRDVTAQVEALEALARSEQLFRTVMQSSAVGMGIHAPDGQFVVVNDALCRIVQRDQSWLIGRHLRDLVHRDDYPLIEAARQRLTSSPTGEEPLELRLQRADGSTAWVRAVGSALPAADGQPVYLLTQATDVTAEHEARAELEYRALHDPLTGLYNRMWILDMLDNELRAAARAHDAVAVLFVDLDNFKVVNDSLGHSAGDEVLCAIAQRLAASVRPRDHAARLGGDEFLVVATDVSGPVDVEALAARVSEVINTELTVQGRPVVISASIGVAVSGWASSAASLLRDADSALFRAKATGRARWQFFDDTMHTEAMARLTTESQLRAGLVAEEFFPCYQPIVTLDPVRIVGYEALARWRHPERGILAPGDFLPVAEETALIVELGDQLLEQVCALLAARPELGPISVNKSPVQIRRAGWREHFVDTLSRHGVDPARLVIEVTETAVLTHLEEVHENLVAVRALGVGLHVDDFGTGFSSIALLRDLPVTGLKLDRSFTSQLGVDSTARVLAAGLASLADGLDLVSIAEGVETAEEAEFLRELGWTHGQGYLFGRPAPEPSLEVLPH